MNGRRSVGFSRRVGLAGALAALTQVRPQPGAAIFITQRGMVGGGLVELAGGAGQANVSLIATQATLADERNVVAGSILWVEVETGVSFASIAVMTYDDMPDQEHGRRIQGTMSANGEGRFPFTLEVVDLGAPGSGLDLIALTVSEVAAAAADDAVLATTTATWSRVQYQAAGRLMFGDIQDVDLEFPVD